MSTTWYRVMWSGACVGWVAYSNTSDVWLPGIVEPDALKAGTRHVDIGRRCSNREHPLRWVDLAGDRGMRQLACLECHALEPQPWNEDDWYVEYDDETMARVKS